MVMLPPHERDCDYEESAACQYTVHFGEGAVRLGEVLKNLGTEDEVYMPRCKGQGASITLYASRLKAVQADVRVVVKRISVGTGCA